MLAWACVITTMVLLPALFLLGCVRPQYDTQMGAANILAAEAFTFNFAANPNETNLTIGGIGGIAKRGWEYLWVEYDDEVSSNRMVKKVKAVHIEKVYRTFNFNLLGAL
jgi:hypothetical protein